ncbi:MAG: AbrB/MazE/SpoVT family DNA-binding domain-containing protein [Spirochaetes bacterium]|nr:MAG: AbrB/MazE/SpoVT family DNA-binding domain-containing protein [Spirochaetota bacterium]
MFSKITDKFQITIPREIRELLKLSRNDSLEWKYKKGVVTVSPAKKSFLAFEGTVKTGPGDIERDIENAKRARAKGAK